MSQEIYNKLVDLIDKKNEIEQKLKTLSDQVKEIAVNLTPDTFEEYSYDEIKVIWNTIKYQVSTPYLFEELIERKKMEKYPEMQKAVYYPEINELSIPDVEKMRLDRAARQNYRTYINQHNMKKLKYPLSENDLEMLKNIGIVEKKYTFLCPECNRFVTSFYEKDLKNFLRTWELEYISENNRKLTENEQKELDELYEKGYFDITIACEDCDEVCKTIRTKEELEKCKDDFFPTFFIKKQPDLSIEKL